MKYRQTYFHSFVMVTRKVKRAPVSKSSVSSLFTSISCHGDSTARAGTGDGTAVLRNAAVWVTVGVKQVRVWVS